MARRRRVLVGAADLLVATTIVAVVAGAVVVVVRQRSDDGAAAAIAAWATDRGSERVAWPPERRAAVPALLASGVVPVLIDASAPAQQYAVARTEVVVTRVGEPAPDLVVESHREGDLVAHRVDLEEAGTVPLEVGDTVSEEISRPYRYAPLRPSTSVPPGDALERELHLAPGRYEVAVEAYVGIEDDDATTSIVLAPAGGDLVADGGQVGRVVEEPLVVELVIPEGTGPGTRLGIGPLGDSGTPTLLVHGWSVTRVADR